MGTRFTTLKDDGLTISLASKLLVLSFGLESRRQRFGAAIVKAVLLLYFVVVCVWMYPIKKAAFGLQRLLLLCLSVIGLAINAARGWQRCNLFFNSFVGKMGRVSLAVYCRTNPDMKTGPIKRSKLP